MNYEIVENKKPDEVGLFGSVQYRGNSVMLEDILYDENNAIAYISIIGNSQIAKALYLEITQTANGKGGDKVIYSKNIQLSIMGGGLRSFGADGSTTYTKIETQLGFGYSAYQIYKSQIFDSPMFVLLQSKEDEAIRSGYRKWLSNLPLPIPKEEEIREQFFLHLLNNELLTIKESISGKFVGMFFCKTLQENHYLKIRRFVESFYRTHKIEREEIA